MFDRRGAGVAIKNADLTPKVLVERVKYIMTSPEILAFMMEAASALARPQATQDIVEELIKIARVKVKS
jgi:UDP-N-acetylglucosamine:LPS N-acetylglucosamine transferase